MDQPTIAQIVQEAAARNGVDPALLGRFAQIESSGNPNAAADGSSAKGLFQFTDPTWKQYGNGADVFDPAANADAAARLLRDNAGALKAAGHEVTPGNAYLAHFAGAGGAKKVLGADSTAPVSAVLGDAAVSANPFLKNMTVADLRAWSDRKMGGGSAPVAAAAPSAGILNRSPVAAPSAGAGLLNSEEATQPDDTASLQQVLAAQQRNDHQPVPALAPIRFAAPRGFDRARFFAALTARRIA